MHRAFVAGASLTEVAAAAGTTEAEAYGRWSAWAEGQERLFLDSGLGVDPVEAEMIQAGLAMEAPG
jgi:hypothetical protein